MSARDPRADGLDQHLSKYDPSEIRILLGKKGYSKARSISNKFRGFASSENNWRNYLNAWSNPHCCLFPDYPAAVLGAINIDQTSPIIARQFIESYRAHQTQFASVSGRGHCVPQLHQLIGNHQQAAAKSKPGQWSPSRRGSAVCAHIPTCKLRNAN